MSKTLPAVQQPGAVMPGEQSNLLEIIARAAIDPRVDADKMERLLAIQERIQAREAEIEFKAALARVQTQAPRVDKKAKIVVPGKDGRSGHSTPYALYEDIDKAMRPLYQAEGFSVAFSAEPSPSGAIWTMILGHRMGHTERYSMPPLPADQTGSKNAVQAIGSSSSYAHRYLVCLVFNVVTVGVDDDAKATGYLNEQELSNVTDMLNACEITGTSKAMADFLRFAEADSVPHIQRYRYEPVMVALRSRLKKQQEGAK